MVFVRLNTTHPGYSSSEPFCFCKQCKAFVLIPSARFCSSCGHRFVEHADPQIIEVPMEDNKKVESLDTMFTYMRERIDWSK